MIKLKHNHFDKKLLCSNILHSKWKNFKSLPYLRHHHKLWFEEGVAASCSNINLDWFKARVCLVNCCLTKLQQAYIVKNFPALPKTFQTLTFELPFLCTPSNYASIDRSQRAWLTGELTNQNAKITRRPCYPPSCPTATACLHRNTC